MATNNLNRVMDTVEKLGKAKAELFSVRIQEEIGKKLTEIRNLNTKFEGETEVVLQYMNYMGSVTTPLL